MSEMRTEEEQVEALKNWWKENGKSLLLGVALALAIVFGWKGWQNNQQVNAENAATLYTNLVQAVAIASTPTATDDQRATATHLAATLKTDYSDSAYAHFGALFSARLAVDGGDFDSAISELDWVLSQSSDSVMKTVASMRKARVLAATGQVDQAVTLLNGLSEAGFKVSIAELKGDLFMQQGDKEKALSAYQTAVDNAQQANRPLLNMKLENLAAEEG
ncbi:hypothetical protein GCM10007941_32540 [Amphritea balenae]|nr:hypothetical protein GCM10007941_32540 [Amphritea balenae]